MYVYIYKSTCWLVSWFYVTTQTISLMNILIPAVIQLNMSNFEIIISSIMNVIP